MKEGLPMPDTENTAGNTRGKKSLLSRIYVLVEETDNKHRSRQDRWVMIRATEEDKAE